MNAKKIDFIRLALDCNVLKFGHFVLKSGRTSPYFFNAGQFYTGNALKILGEHYARVLLEQKVDFDTLFGPAYKGLPLATATAIALAEKGKHVHVTFNRKEVKDHGEGGQLMGAPLQGKIVMIDDVITAGTAFRETEQLIQQHQGNLTTVIIALDRLEKGLTDISALEAIRRQGIDVHAIITLLDIIEYLETIDSPEVDILKTYYEQNCVKK
jgi:orotate phosphoribosyltransferase